MTADELARWLRAHNHDDVDVLDETEVESSLRGRSRIYVLTNVHAASLDVGGDHWRIERPKKR